MLGLNGEVAGSQEQGDIGIIIGHWNVVRATICEKHFYLLTVSNPSRCRTRRRQ